MIGLSTPTADSAGSLILPIHANNPYDGQRRGSVTATLDGGSVSYDTGYSISDTTLSMTLKRPTKTMLLSLQYLVAYYGQLVLCSESGAFLGILSFTMSRDSVALSFRILSRLN